MVEIRRLAGWRTGLQAGMFGSLIESFSMASRRSAGSLVRRKNVDGDGDPMWVSIRRLEYSSTYFI